MERAPRVIYLTDRSEAIIKRLCRVHKTGTIFRNTQGRAWTADATNCRFMRLKEKLGQKYCLTHFRHTFCQRLLTAEVDALTVSVLMGQDVCRLDHESTHVNQ